MISGVRSFTKTVTDVVEVRLLADPACKRQWEEVSDRPARHSPIQKPRLLR